MALYATAPPVFCCTNPNTIPNPSLANHPYLGTLQSFLADAKLHPSATLLASSEAKTKILPSCGTITKVTTNAITDASSTSTSETVNFYVQAIVDARPFWLAFEFGEGAADEELRGRFSRTDAAVTVLCGRHGSVARVEIWEDKSVTGKFWESKKAFFVQTEGGGEVRCGWVVGGE